jgi:hypothetical protein
MQFGGFGNFGQPGQKNQQQRQKKRLEDLMNGNYDQAGQSLMDETGNRVGERWDNANRKVGRIGKLLSFFEGSN